MSENVERLPKINIIGAGKLGKTIGYLIHKHGAGKILGVVNRSLPSSEEAVQFIGAGQAFADIADLPLADIILIACKDDYITEAARKLPQNQQQKPVVVSHFCCVHAAVILDFLRPLGYKIASLHPMHSFASPRGSISSYQGSYCALEGEPEAVAVLEPVFAKIGSNVLHIDGGKKRLHHAAGVMAANYVVTLYHEAVECLQKAGFTTEVAGAIIGKLMGGTVQNIQNSDSAQEALTGPISRGDVQTVKAHVDAFSDPERKNLYKMLGKRTLRIADLDNDTQREMKDVLE